MVSVQHYTIHKRKENFRGFDTELLLMGVIKYSKPLTHSYFELASTEYDRVTSQEA